MYAAIKITSATEIIVTLFVSKSLFGLMKLCWLTGFPKANLMNFPC
jgi:hypothetical protein